MKLAMNVLCVLLFLTSINIKSVFAEEKTTAFVTICFDDAHRSVFTHALPVFQQYGLAATAYVPTIGIDEKPYWHMSWKQIIALQDSGWEIGSHSHTHASMTTLSPEKIDEELRTSQSILAEHGIEAKTFAAPLGDNNDETIDGAKKYFIGQRGTERVRGHQLDLSLNELNVDSYDISGIQLWYDYPLVKIKGLVDLAIEKKQWAVFYLHAISEGQTEDKDYKFDAQVLGMLVSYLKDLQNEGKIKVVTIAEFLEQRKKK